MSELPTKILVATDGSTDAELAATTAVALAKVTGSELHVVTVAEEYPSYDAYRPLAHRARELAREVLDGQVKKIENLGGTIAGSHLRMGGAAEESVALAEELEAGLVVVGSRGKGRIKRLVMGSVSDSVVRHAPCPVLVVRDKPVVFPATILLATDGSEEAARAARTAADLAESTGSELHLVHVGAEVTHGAAPGVAVGPLPGVHQDELDRQARELLDTQVAQIKAAGAGVAEAHLRVGRVDEEIIVLAEELGADLVAMGGRGLGGLRRALVGSVSDSVVRHSHCPVLIVRERMSDAHA